MSTFTVATEAGAVKIEATPAGVFVNGRRVLAHEAAALGAELVKAADASRIRAAQVMADAVSSIVPF